MKKLAAGYPSGSLGRKAVEEEIGKVRSKKNNLLCQQISKIFETLNGLAKTEDNNRIETGFKG